MALGFALLKDDGKFCYIIPQTMLTKPDYDVVRYHLSHDYTIDSLITFAGKLFVGRSTDQSKAIYTSSLILVCTKKRPPARHKVECVSVVEGTTDPLVSATPRHDAELDTLQNRTREGDPVLTAR